MNTFPFLNKNHNRCALMYNTEAKNPKKRGVWDPMPELTLNSPLSTPESTPTHLP